MVLFLQEAVAVLGMACYIGGATPSMLLLASLFADDFRQGVLANANCGGESDSWRGRFVACSTCSMYSTSSVYMYMYM